MKTFGLALCVLMTAVTAMAVMPGTDLYVPAVAHSDGFGGAQWRAAWTGGNS